MSLKSSEALKALKLIKMPKPQSVADRIAPKKAGKVSEGSKAEFAGTDVAKQRDHLISKRMGAGVVGRSLVARAGVKKESKPASKAQAVARIYDAADDVTKRDILKHAVGTALKNTDTNFSTKKRNTTAQV